MRDQLQNECNVVEKVNEYYSHQQINPIAGSEEYQLIL